MFNENRIEKEEKVSRWRRKRVTAGDVVWKENE